MSENSDTIRWRWPMAVAAATVFVGWVAVMLLASQFGDWRLWGFNHLAFTNSSILPYFLSAAVIGLLFIAVPVGMRPKLPMPLGWPVGLTLAVAVGVVGWLLRSQAPLLGDGMMRAADAAAEQIPMPSEMVASYLSNLLVRDLPAALKIDGQMALQLISVVSGIVLVAGLWWLAPRTNERNSRQVIFWILTLGTVRLFAGYVESYAPAVMAVTLWILAGVAYNRGRCSALPLIVFWALAALSHATAIMLVPATAWLLFVGRGRERADRRGMVAFGLLAVILSGFIIFRIQSLQVDNVGLGTGHFLLNWFAGPPHFYGVFSLAHLIDFLNQWILMVPIFLFAVLPVWQWRKVRPEERSGPSASTVVFWILAAALPLLGSLVLDPKLGWARDWDLYALLFTPAAVGMALALVRIDSVPMRRAAGAMAILSAGLWLSFSPDADAELRRYESLLELDRSRAAYGHEILARYHRTNERPLGEIAEFERALGISENNRYRANIAAAYIRLDRYDDAITWYESILASDSTFDLAIGGMALALDRAGRFDEALVFAQKALAVAPREAVRIFGVGVLLMKTGNHASAIPYLEASSQAVPDDAQCLDFLAQCYHRVERLPDARATWQQAIQVDPSYTQPLLSATALELLAGHVVEAKDWLAEYERRVPKAIRSGEARALADSLARYQEVDQ